MKQTKKHLFCLLLFGILSFLSFLQPSSVLALSSEEIQSRNACNTLNFELAYANYDGSLSTKSCHENYIDAKAHMDASNENDSDNLVILERKNEVTSIIDAKYALVDYDQKISITSNLYTNLEDTKAATYIIGGESDDAAYLGIDYNSKRIKIKVSGFTGWLDKYDSSGNNQYDIIPLSWVKSPSYYRVSDSHISHYLPTNLFQNGKLNYITFGPKPDQLSVGKYYSYDGKYFYQDLKVMLQDYKVGTYNNAVNSQDPYYNYYLYLSHRTKSTYSVTDINDYVSKVLGYTEKASANPPLSHQSMLFDEGNSFYNAESLYGVNSLLIFGVARNESGNGRSKLSILKNNVFGHGAVDSDPYAQGDAYLSVGYGIYAHAYKWLSYGYLQPGDYSGRFNGAHLGNKSAGLNVKYASDPYWGEKAAANYYQFDSYYGLQDYQYYSLAVKKDSTTVVYPKKTSNISGLNVSSSYYKLILQDTPIVIIEEVQGDSVEGNPTWYKIMSDPTLDTSLEYTGDSKSNPRVEYKWDSSYVYVPAAYFTKINQVEVKNPNDILKYDEVDDPNNSLENSGEDIEKNPSTDENIGQQTPIVPETPLDKTPATDNPATSLTIKDNNLYYFEKLQYENNLLIVQGFLAIAGINNRVGDTISHRLIFKNVDSSIEYFYPLERWTSNYPFEMTNSDEKVNYDYSGGWFKGSIDISYLPQGDYQVYIEQSNGVYKTRAHFNNLFFKDMVRKFTTLNGKGFNFQMNYYEKEVPLEVSVRDMGLITTANPPTIDTMYNSFEKLEFIENSLHIRGTSHSVGVEYGVNSNVSRTIILENISTFERYTYDVGSITTGDYIVSLRVSDGKDKTRAWFDTIVDLSSLPKGVYAIYIHTKGAGGEDYGELNDVLYTTVNQTTSINGKNIYLRRVDSKRFRIELVIE